MRKYRVLLAVVGLFAFTSAAEAGPIWFSFRIQSDSSPSEGEGAGHLHVTHPGAGRRRLDPPRHDAIDLVRLGLQARPPGHDPDWVPGTSTFTGGATSFDITFDLTDLASGESESVTLTGTATSRWMHRWDGLFRPDGAAIEFANSADLSFQLGQNRYEILASGGHDPYGENVSALVAITASPMHHNPEPGTLILGGLGLLSAAGLRFRNRFRGE